MDSPIPLSARRAVDAVEDQPRTAAGVGRVGVAARVRVAQGGLDVEEVAREVGLSVSGVRKRLRRLEERLRELEAKP